MFGSSDAREDRSAALSMNVGQVLDTVVFGPWSHVEQRAEIARIRHIRACLKNEAILKERLRRRKPIDERNRRSRRQHRRDVGQSRRFPRARWPANANNASRARIE